MSLLDHPAMISMLAVVGGSVVGASGTMVSAWISQRHQDRRELVAKRVFHLEQLYSDFINEGARLLVDAAQHSLENPGTLVPIYGLISRIRLSSSTEVIESGERLIDTIIATYFEPNLTLEDIRSAPSKHNDRLFEFSNICRRELESLSKGF